MNKILVPYDFSKSSDHAVDFAVQLADKHKAKGVILYNVIEHPSESRMKTMGATPINPMENVYMTSLIQLTEKKLIARIGKLKAGAANVTYKIHLGNPYVSLSAEVAKVEVDLVVMGTKGSEGLDELFIGSNAERMVRTSKCPVITLKEGSKLEKIKELVFASNFHDLKAPFIKKLKELQTMLGAKLRIVKINTPANFTSTRHDMMQMEAFVKNNSIKNYTIDIFNFSNEENGIVDFADYIKADMIALGTNQRSGLTHYFNGSIAEDVVNHAKRPVWTYQLEE